MDTLAQLRAFTAVVEAGGFAAAARATGQSRSALNRLVLGLEARLGAQLLHRTTRSVSATSTGRALHARARRILDDLRELEDSVTEAGEAPVGRLTISAPPAVGVPDFGALIVAFLARHPALTIDATFETRLVDPVAEGYDMVIRAARPDETTNLVDHRLARLDYIMCAHPDYLAARGTPMALADLAGHAALFQGRSGPSPTWTLEGPDGVVSAPIAPALTTNSLDTLLHAVRARLGIAVVPAHLVRAECAAGTLTHVLPAYRAPSRMLQVIYPPARHLSAKVRLFTEFVAEQCRALEPADGVPPAG